MSTDMDFLRDNAGGGGDGEDHPSVYLGQVGRKIKGRIVGTPRKADTKFGPRLLVDLVVLEGANCTKGKQGADGEAVVGETLTWWIKPGDMAAAVRDALEDAEAPGMEEGGIIACAIVDQVDVGKGNPLNKHKAAYERPKAAVAIGDDLL